MIVVRMPKFGSADVGSVTRWLVREGQVVLAGDLIAEIDTEKIASELESPVGGRISQLLVALNAEVAVGTPIIEIEPLHEE